MSGKIFVKLDIAQTIKRYQGDQDYIGAVIDHNQRRHFEQKQLQSWRWQISEGGYDFKRRQPQKPWRTHCSGRRTPASWYFTDVPNRTNA
jgi:hypothetical protein